MKMTERLLDNAMDVENYSPQVQKLLAEWEQDRAMAKERDMTGNEPACRPLVTRRETRTKVKVQKRVHVMER